MWIFLSDAFLSIVADKDDLNGGRLLVRARRKGDIERVFPGAKVSPSMNADYAYRAWVARGAVAKALQNQVAELDYSNFKNSIHDEGYHDAALGAWSSMRGWQERLKRKFR